jgi:hypothetical protein
LVFLILIAPFCLLYGAFQIITGRDFGEQVKPQRHDGTILAERPNQMWGIDATAGFTAQDGQVMILAMVDHYSAYPKFRS